MDTFSGLKVITCGSPKSITDIELNIPVTNKILYNAREIGQFIDKHTTSMLFIILFLDVFHEDMASILHELSERNNIYAILICDNLLINLQKVFPISSNLITNEITFRAIDAYESTIKKFIRLGTQKSAIVMEEKANDLKRWFTTNIKVECSHIVIFPVNTDYSNLIDFQLNLMDFCKLHYPTRQIIIRTINDYIPWSESSVNDQNRLSDSTLLIQKEYEQFVLDNMQKLSSIRIFLVGNETHITNECTNIVLKKELDNGPDNIFGFVQECTFMENEPVKNEIKENLAAVLGCQWPITKTKPIRLDNLKNNTSFYHAILYAIDTHEDREGKANMSLREKYLNYRGTSPSYSLLNAHLTGEAQDEHISRNTSSNYSINTSMQCDYHDSEMN